MTAHEDKPEREVEEMEARSKRLEAEIADTREDWEHKRRDQSVPGAVAPEEPSADVADEREPWPDE